MSAAKKGWSDTEKAGIYFQIIAKMEKPIPWNSIELPEGRTLKAVQVMFDKEKSKVRAAKDGNEDAALATPTKSNKRNSPPAADADNEEGSKPAKKPKTPRKKGIAKKVTTPKTDPEAVESADDEEIKDEEEA